MLHVQNLTGGYDKLYPTIHNVSFQVEKGSFFALLGPNGSGKTTIIRLLMGILPITSGKVMLDGISIDHYSSVGLAKKISVLSQENQVGMDFTVEEIVALGRYPYQVKRLFYEETQTDKDAVKEAMKLTSIESYKTKPFLSLSGGEKQRVLLAKALAQEPELIILDEPTNHLDIKHTLEILDLLKRLQKEKNLTVVAILHDLNIASIYAEAFAMLKHGKILQVSKGFIKQDEALLQNVYETDLQMAAHPELPKMQISFMPQQIPKKEGPSSSISITKDENRLRLQLNSQFRTLSLGKEGEGLTWCAGILCTNVPDSETNEHYIRWEYPESRISCFQEEIFGTECILIGQRDGADLHLALFTGHPLSDTDLMNVAVSLAEIRTMVSDVPITGRLVIGTNRMQRKKATGLEKNLLAELNRWLSHKIQGVK
ncbi:ABC transporter ATP-binding protein [Peribacillus deserti]|uniref:ABC transporter ATP-binding protein n=1 Tax=Peribacillus deserti TaxID=673318 RepID=A0A2N5M8W8_9BACI|nr:ABC transporter ATP-binding protein [Peribacillus deserti]PLT30811.1 ABC transporter ATP-binding protein [Peribacillus deserti]